VRKLFLALVLWLIQASMAFAQIGTAWVAMRTGRYDEAFVAFEQYAMEEPDEPVGHRLWVRTLMEVGRYEDAESLARGFLEQHPTSYDLHSVHGEALVALGRLDEAERAFSQSIAGSAPDALVAVLNRARLRESRGQWDAAEAGYESLIYAYNAESEMDVEELMAVGTACRRLGPTDPQLYKDALRAFEEAIAADPGGADARVRLGELLLEKYDSPAAKKALREALAANPNHPRGTLAMARALGFDGVPAALDQARKALVLNPRLVDAHVYVAAVLLELERYDDATVEAELALETNPVSLEALAVLAGARYLHGDEEGFREARDRALAVNPRYGELFETLSELCVRNRLYREAAEFAREAVRIDPRSWSGYANLGLNQLRLGEIETGRRNLEKAFVGDPYNVWTKNTLDLLDTFERYTTLRTQSFELFMREDEAAALAPYLGALAEEALATLEERYQYAVPRPIRVEVYPSHADFSVRTVGLAGLGALGVCFGRVLALDSPSARPRGSFNWGSTLWHEITHTITLGVTEHRIPRWLTEGISVHEERRGRPGWGDGVTLGFLVAVKRGDLLGIEKLNDGFVRPQNPEQVGLSYYQASLAVAMIERDHGFDAIRALLEGYRERKSTAELFRSVLGLEVDVFDAALEEYVNERFAHPLASIKLRDVAPERLPHRDELVEAADAELEDFVAQLAAARALLGNRQIEEAKPYLERAYALFPDYAEDDAPTWHLARIAREAGDADAALEYLRALTALDETHLEAHIEQARLEEEAGDKLAATRTLEAALSIDPLDPALHVKLVGLYEDAEQWGQVVRERRALVDLGPVDMPEALYQLARAHQAAGELGDARRVVLEALDLAPLFRRAQSLLLELHRERRTDEGQRLAPSREPASDSVPEEFKDDIS
jgi:tetratricopeptide (TPR) repeat protein